MRLLTCSRSISTRSWGDGWSGRSCAESRLGRSGRCRLVDDGARRLAWRRGEAGACADPGACKLNPAEVPSPGREGMGKATALAVLDLSASRWLSVAEDGGLVLVPGSGRSPPWFRRWRRRSWRHSGRPQPSTMEYPATARRALDRRGSLCRWHRFDRRGK